MKQTQEPGTTTQSERQHFLMIHSTKDKILQKIRKLFNTKAEIFNLNHLQSRREGWDIAETEGGLHLQYFKWLHMHRMKCTDPTLVVNSMGRLAEMLCHNNAHRPSVSARSFQIFRHLIPCLNSSHFYSWGSFHFHRILYLPWEEENITTTIQCYMFWKLRLKNF